MTAKKELQKNTIEIGKIIKSHRMSLMTKRSSRDYFINDRSSMGLLPVDWISTKTLSNIENGRNLPSLITLKKLSSALEIDFIDLVKEIEKYLY